MKHLLCDRCCVRAEETGCALTDPQVSVSGGGGTVDEEVNSNAMLEIQQSMRANDSAWEVGEGVTQMITFGLGFEGFIGVRQNHSPRAQECSHGLCFPEVWCVTAMQSWMGRRKS